MRREEGREVGDIYTGEGRDRQGRKVVGICVMCLSVLVGGSDCA
jgi:hypothetical protein